MHPLITQAILTDHEREMHTRAALAAQARRARRSQPALGPAVSGSPWSAPACWRARKTAARCRPSDRPTETWPGGKMKYMLMVCRDPSIKLNPEEQAAMEGSVRAWLEELTGRGMHMFGQELRPVSDATTVRVRDAEALLSDGPFAETKEHIAGFDMIECADLDEALDVAGRHPVAKLGAIEVRPFWVE